MKQDIKLQKNAWIVLVVLLATTVLIWALATNGSNVKAFSSENSLNEVLAEQGVSIPEEKVNVIAVNAKWCSACSTMHKFIPEVMSRYSDQLNYMYVDVDEFPGLSLYLDNADLPVFYVVDQTGNIITNFGYEDQEGFESRLQLLIDNQEV